MVIIAVAIIVCLVGGIASDIVARRNRHNKHSWHGVAVRCYALSAEIAIPFLGIMVMGL